MSSNKDNTDCPCSGACLTVGQGSPGRHREPSVGLLDEAERRKGQPAHRLLRVSPMGERFP